MTRRDFLLLGVAAGAFATFSPNLLLAQDADLPEVPELVLGNPEATVTLTEYASYTCPHCATFHDAVFKPLKRDYIDTGKIKFIYREVFFDRYGLWAAMVARCGGEMRYFGIQEMLYKGQRDWAASDNPNDVVDNLRRIGRAAGLDNDQLDACLSDGDMAQAMVAKHQTDSEADGITSTPSLVLNGVKHSNMSFAELSRLIDAELAK
ncbi:MAG: thioredoxin domain-containing protein [Pseudorhodobacter sp.]